MQEESNTFLKFWHCEYILRKPLTVSITIQTSSSRWLQKYFLQTNLHRTNHQIQGSSHRYTWSVSECYYISLDLLQNNSLVELNLEKVHSGVKEIVKASNHWHKYLLDYLIAIPCLSAIIHRKKER